MAERPDVLRERADVAPDAVARSLDAYPREAGTIGETLHALDAERRPAAVAAVADRLIADDVAVRRAAALALSDCFETCPEAGSAVTAELARALQDGDHVVRKYAGTALQAIARRDPRAASEAVDALPALLDPGNPDLLSVGLDIAATVAESDPGAAVPLLDPVLEALVGLADRGAPTAMAATDSDTSPAGREYQRQYATELDRQRNRAAAVVEHVLTDRPDAFVPAEPAFRDALRREALGTARATLAETLGRVAESEPEAIVSAIDDLAALLGDGDPVVAASAAWALGMLADPYGQRVADAVDADLDALARLLAVDPPGARIASATLLAYVAEHRPDALEPATDSLVAALDDDNPDVRASAALALGHAGRADALADLRDVADGDPDERVRSTAALAVERVDPDS